ncbi:hypothetical protein NGM99_13165 [Mesorhizobium sp. RP14(2022)]|jgi:hypothetical protein|uniref:Uncharacterized protein n=1 Tax=Mesorhizobium liriopis TaxID=2953882 RepID=A0ABT1C997_9HYPH|nr:hypothetical protein [Mesorhizobium liriopis]MCO6050731.1 hypothetical protein [Mesorhizobium liriopis]
MNAAMVGAGAGLILALAEFAFFQMLAKRVDLPETRKALRVTAILQIVLFPVVGWFVGPLLFGD